MGERLQKLISAAGVASRRAAEVLIQEGRVTVNGTAADDTMTHTPGAFQDSGDVQISDTTDTLLGVQYENLGLGGSVTIDGLGGGANSLVINGTDAAELIEVEENGEDSPTPQLLLCRGEKLGPKKVGMPPPGNCVPEKDEVVSPFAFGDTS